MYLNLTKRYEKNILFNLGSHIHLFKVSAPTSEEIPNMNLKMLATLSISPIYGNNPGFTEILLETD